jgi:hypothetical protein
MDTNAYKKRTKDDATSMWIEPPMVTGRSKRQRPLQRSIHFADAHYTTTTSCTIPLHTTYHVENWMNLVDKEDLWVHPSETLQNVLSIRAHGRLYQQQIPTEATQLAYSEALQSSYLQCCCDMQDSNEQNNCIDSSEKSEQSYVFRELLNSNDESFNYQLLGLHRGIEAYYVPDLAIARLSVRKKLIQTIVLIDQVLRCHPHRDLLLGNIIRPLTIPSKRFAHMLGIVDEMNAVNKSLSPQRILKNHIAT